ncbi:hypothetical protein NQ314_018926 [Rhamnusium bicolor]|uniref:Uncharacterized protein n=1 Tax=Rhamnusium bicolor TaxID=1586634 RepID=A0AAV8WP02_9CUCU|nr:hypothetical protein NQ314_018926 [Rhamnusium bicolor]
MEISQVITGAGHHVYADKPEAFNQIVVDACNYNDQLSRNNLALMPPDSNEESEEPESDKDITPQTRNRH